LQSRNKYNKRKLKSISNIRLLSKNNIDKFITFNKSLYYKRKKYLESKFPNPLRFKKLKSKISDRVTSSNKDKDIANYQTIIDTSNASLINKDKVNDDKNNTSWQRIYINKNKYQDSEFLDSELNLTKDASKSKSFRNWSFKDSKDQEISKETESASSTITHP